METLRQIFKKPLIYLIIIIIGVLIKFYGLENRFFWLDEIYTICHTSGINTSEFLDQIPTDTIVNISHYNNLLNLNNGQHTIESQLVGLSQMIQLSPLHYVFLVFWQRIVGSGYLDYRLFTIFIFILTLPLLYFLSKLLFKSRLTGLIATSLYAISPFIHSYAQDARYYILWAFSLILINYLLLIVVKKNTVKWWIIYAAAAIISIYVSTLSAIILLGHFIYICIFYRKFWLRSCISAIVIFLAYFPWLIELFKNKQEVFSSLSWQNGNLSFLEILISPWLGMAHIFSYTENFTGPYDLMYGSNYSSELILSVIINVLLIVIIVTSIVFLVRKMPVKIVWFLLLIVIPGILFFNILDLTMERHTSLAWRYHILYFLGIILIISGFFEKKFSDGKLLYPLLYIGIVTLSIISMIRISVDDCWATYGFEQCDEKVVAAEIFSNDRSPLIITDCATGLGIMGFLETIVECTSKDIDVLYVSDPQNIGNLLSNNNYSNIYLCQISNGLVFELLKQYRDNQLYLQLPKIILLNEYLKAFLNEEDPEFDNYTLEEYDIDFTTSEVEIIVIPKILISASTIFITGNHSSIGNWSPNEVALEEDSDGKWIGVFIIDNGMQLEYKITRGDWEKELVDKAGRVMPNFKLEVQNDTTITIIIDNWKDLI